MIPNIELSSSASVIFPSLTELLNAQTLSHSTLGSGCQHCACHVEALGEVSSKEARKEKQHAPNKFSRFCPPGQSNFISGMQQLKLFKIWELILLYMHYDRVTDSFEYKENYCIHNPTMQIHEGLAFWF